MLENYRHTLEVFGMAGKRCVVTGAAGLLGRVLTDALVRAGAFVELVDLDEAALDAVTNQLPVNVVTSFRCHHCDLRNEAEVIACFSRIAASGQIHALINAAGIDHKVLQDTISTDDSSHFSSYNFGLWCSIISGNLNAMFLATREACRSMEPFSEGSIVNICSTYALVGPNQRLYDEVFGASKFLKSPAYATAKAGALGFTRAIAAHYSDTRIRVNAISPGGILSNQSESFVRSYSSRTIMGRMAQATDLVGAVIYLCSDASSYVTGSNLVVDGGWTAI